MRRVAPLERRLEPHAWGEGADFFGPRHDYRESLMMRVLRRRLDGQRVLNAGCGAGSMTLGLLDEGYEVTSIDASESFVENLAKRLREAYPDAHAPVLVADVHQLPFQDRDFDAVVCGEVLEHLEDDRAAVGELARVLRPGGSLVVSVPANPWRYDWADHWAGHQRRYTEDGLVDLMLDGGLTAIEVTAWGFPLTGLYHRFIYERFLRRQLRRSPASGSNGDQRPPQTLLRVVRICLEFDTLFLGRRPGYLGFLVAARRPDSSDGRRP